MHKSTQINVINQPQYHNVDLYNEEVKNFLQNNPISPLVQQAIKLFNDAAQRDKLTILQYNEEVEKFNGRYGYYILKKENSNTSKPNKYYAYINYPYISAEDKKNISINFKKYKKAYNLKVDKANNDIKLYNNEVVKAPLTTQEKKEAAKFAKDNNALTVWEYNKLVEENNLNNPIYLKKKVQKLRQHHVTTFRCLVYFYVGQLKRRNLKLMQKNKPTSVLKTQLPPLQINHRDLARHCIDDGIEELDLDKRTLQNHVKRLIEAEVLVNYRFYFRNQPISVGINREILEISDYTPPKSKNPINKGVNEVNKKTFHIYTHSNTRTYKEKEIEGCAKSTEENKCYSEAESNPKFYKSTNMINMPKETGGAQAELKTNTSAAITNNFLSSYVPPFELAKELSSGKYNSHKAFRTEKLQRVIQYGAVSNNDFRLILIQDFVKMSAKLWKNQTIHPKVWFNAINQLSETLFKNITSKENMLNKYAEYRWKLSWAMNWFNNQNKFGDTEKKPLVPSFYFDPLRKKQEEMGFFGLHLIFLASKKYAGQTKEEKEKRIEAARKRKLSIKHKKCFANALERFNNNSYTLKQLKSFVKNNLPKKYTVQLEKLNHH